MTEIRTGSGTGTGTEPIIEFADLRRSFIVRQKAGRVRRTKKIVHAVDGVSVRIGAGEAVGYIGANGAGKSTTIKMLTGILIPTSGPSTHLWLQPGPPTAATRSRDRGGVWAAQPAVVGPSAARLVPILVRSIGCRHRSRKRTDQLVERLGLAEHSTYQYASSRLANGCVAKWPRRSSIARGCLFSMSPLSGWT